MIFTKNEMLIAAIAAVVFTGFGIYAGEVYRGAGINGTCQKQVSVKSGDNTYRAGWEAAKKRLQETGFGGPMMAGMEIRNISGSVEKVDGNKISLKIRALEPLADSKLDTRVITVSDKTKIVKMTQKDQAVFQKEMSDFQKKMQDNMKNASASGSVPGGFIGMPPEMYNKEDVKISNIKQGDMVMVAANEDIKEKAEFEALEINIQPAPPSMPAAPGSIPPAAGGE